MINNKWTSMDIEKIDGMLWQIHEHRWTPMKRDQQSMNIYEKSMKHPWKSMGNTWTFTKIHEHRWTLMKLVEQVWTCMRIDDNWWTYMRNIVRIYEHYENNEHPWNIREDKWQCMNSAVTIDEKYTHTDGTFMNIDKHWWKFSGHLWISMNDTHKLWNLVTSMDKIWKLTDIYVQVQ